MEACLFLENKNTCKACGNDTFYRVTHFEDCDSCPNNGIEDTFANGDSCYRYTGEGDRTEAAYEGTCLLGDSEGCGCVITVCSKCNALHTHEPLSDI